MILPIGPFSFDLATSHAFQSSQSAWLTFLARAITLLAQPEIIVPTVVIIAAWLFYRHQKIRDLILILLMSGNLLTLIIKAFAERPRPSSSLVNVLVSETQSGFPSGHAVSAVLMAGAIWVIFRARKWAWLHPLLILYVLAVGWTRVYLGVHWASDVLAGYLFGLVWLAIVLLIIPKSQQN